MGSCCWINACSVCSEQEHKGIKTNSKSSNLEILSVCLSGLSNSNREEIERNESCHFGHPSGLMVKGKIHPRRERDLFDSWLSHTLLNRRPIALSSLFCKCSKVKINIRHLLHRLVKRVYRRSFWARSACTYLAAGVYVEKTHPTGQLLGVLDAVS